MTIPDRRLLSDWLNGYLELTNELEAPARLHLWTGLTVMAAALRRRVFMEMTYETVYPNLYVIIVAESAKVRKSAAMDFGRALLMDAVPEVRVMQDSMTSQGLIKALNHKMQVIKDDKIQEELRSDVAIFADEVANLFSYEKIRASQMVIFLTRTYGCPAVYDHTTVKDSIVRLHNLYPVLLGGTDPRNLKVLPDDAIGGLTGRLIWVIERERRSNNPGWKRDEKRNLQRELLREYLIHDLRRISNLSGEVAATAEAMDFYDSWYNELSKRDTRDPSTDAFYHRCHTTALRIGQLLSISTSDDLVVNSKHMADAVKLIEMQLPEIKRVVLWSGNSMYEQQRAKFIHFLQNAPNHAALRSIVLKYMGMQVEEFDKLTLTLVQDGTLEAIPLGIKGTAFKLTKEGMSFTAPGNPHQ